MAHKISVEAVVEASDYRDLMSLLEAITFDEVNAPACCSEHCEVEPDGTCPHGFDSVMLECGMM